MGRRVVVVVDLLPTIMTTVAGGDDDDDDDDDDDVMATLGAWAVMGVAWVLCRFSFFSFFFFFFVGFGFGFGFGFGLSRWYSAELNGVTASLLEGASTGEQAGRVVVRVAIRTRARVFKYFAVVRGGASVWGAKTG